VGDINCTVHASTSPAPPPGWGLHRDARLGPVCSSLKAFLQEVGSRAAQNPAPTGNTNNECLKNIFMKIFFSGSLLGRNTFEALQRLFLHKVLDVLVFTSLPVGISLASQRCS